MALKHLLVFFLLACAASQTAEANGLSGDECTRLGELAEQMADMHARGFPVDPVYAAVASDTQASLDMKLLRLEMTRWVFANATMSSRKLREKVEEKCGSGTFPWN
ncbi:hypothetical protein SAMN02799615_00416 [Dyella marensis]|uniref:Uncharacterized protein n=1 Tax=Dyella marensis TaxID=500610 RepID=A0A1I1XXI7_9GAMM|nr:MULTISPECIES: hypothetical protein [Dyella]SFE11929.1 hypothetical protein SAMN02799615_00416 [Dyella marensis]